MTTEEKLEIALAMLKERHETVMSLMYYVDGYIYYEDSTSGKVTLFLNQNGITPNVSQELVK